MTEMDLMHRTKQAIVDAETLGFEGTAEALKEILKGLKKSRMCNPNTAPEAAESRAAS